MGGLGRRPSPLPPLPSPRYKSRAQVSWLVLSCLSSCQQVRRDPGLFTQMGCPLYQRARLAYPALATPALVSRGEGRGARP